jgi:hypothetical protein
VVAGWGTVSVDIPASLSGHGRLLDKAVCITVSAAVEIVVYVLESVVTLVVGSVDRITSCSEV